MTIQPACRLCNAPLDRVFVDLGMSPPSNAFLREDRLLASEVFHPLRVFVCASCLLVQLPEHESAREIFGGEYLYFSSYSMSWLAHCERYASHMIERFSLGKESLVVEVASNDGYLLQYFAQAGVPVLGIEPAANVARVAREERGIETVVDFFGARVAANLVAKGKRALLMAANNVLAHVPDIHDFVEGFRLLLMPGGVATFEFPHLMRLMAENQFDTIYHEHFSYLSLFTARRALAEHGLRVFDIDELPTHGGSLRLYVCHRDDPRGTGPAVDALAAREAQAGLDTLEAYRSFRPRVECIKRDLLAFLIEAARAGKKVAGYGAAAKGNTLLNYCGIREDLLSFVVDRSPHKQGLHLPGTHVAVHAPEHVFDARPDYLLILPWNLKAEIIEQMAGIRQWGGKFIVPIPALEVIA